MPAPKLLRRGLPAFLAGVVAFGALVFAVACLDTTPRSERGRVVVLAPDSTREPLTAVIASFSQTQAEPMQAVRYGHCGDLADDAAGGRGHIIITAHPAYSDYIAERTQVLAKAPLASNRLLVVGPSGSTDGSAVTDLGMLLRSDLSSIAVPATDTESLGMYAREAMLRYGIWSRVQPRLRQLAGSREALDAVLQNDAEAAFVFASDVVRRGEPVIVTIDPAFHQPILYEVLLLDDALPQARAFYDYLVGPEGVDTFVARGFQPVQ